MRTRLIFRALLVLAVAWSSLRAASDAAASGSAAPTVATSGTRVHLSAAGFTPGERSVRYVGV
ncbi:MAG: hypothetical protein HGA45_07220 [Chloroflexales bacterium]|nr:hypothetical protein [Chloroflexales bacterium]